MTRKKIYLCWAWIDPQSDVFTTQSPEELAGLLLPGDPLLRCTEKRLTGCFEDAWGWYPRYPDELT